MEIKVEADTLEEALKQASSELGCTVEEMEYRSLAAKMAWLGQKDDKVRIRAWKKGDDSEEELPEPVPLPERSERSTSYRRDERSSGRRDERSGDNRGYSRGYRSPDNDNRGNRENYGNTRPSSDVPDENFGNRAEYNKSRPSFDQSPRGYGGENRPRYDRSNSGGSNYNRRDDDRGNRRTPQISYRRDGKFEPRQPEPEAISRPRYDSGGRSDRYSSRDNRSRDYGGRDNRNRDYGSRDNYRDKRPARSYDNDMFSSEPEEPIKTITKLEVSAKTVEQALTDGARQLKCTMEELGHKILPAMTWLGHDKDTVRVLVWSKAEEEELYGSGSDDDDSGSDGGEGNDDGGAFETDPEGSGDKLKPGAEAARRTVELIDAELAEKVRHTATILNSAICPEAGMEIEDIDGEIRLRLIGDDADILLEENAEPLDAYQYLIARLIFKEGSEYRRIKVNVNNYRQQVEEQLRVKAVEMAKLAKEEQRPVELEPLDPGERRVVHMALESVTGVRTESHGRDPLKTITIIPE